MANIITAGNSTNGGTAISTDTSGTLNIVTGSGSGANAITIDASQNVSMSAAQTISGNLSFNSGYGSAAVAYGCRAWVNFNGTGTPAIRAQGNVSGITDTGVGSYTINFTNAMPDINFSAFGVHNWTSNGNGFFIALPDSTANVKIQTTQSNTNVDCTFVSVAIFR